MKNRMAITGLALLWFAVAGAGSAKALPSNQITYGLSFDENGNGEYAYIDPPLQLAQGMASTFEADPLSGVDTVEYTLPVSVPAEDIAVTDGSGSNAPISDLLRFESGTELFVYSDLPSQGETASLADVGIPATFQANEVFVPEESFDGDTGLERYPVYQSGNTTVSIAGFISDTPEPTGLALMGLACLGLIMRTPRHRFTLRRKPI